MLNNELFVKHFSCILRRSSLCRFAESCQIGKWWKTIRLLGQWLWHRGSVTRLGDFLGNFLLQKTKVVQMFGLGFFLFQQLVMLMLKWNGIKAIHWLVVSIIKHRKSRFCLNWNNKNGEFKMKWTVLHKNRLCLAFMLTYTPRAARNNFFQFLNFPQKRFISSLVQFFFQWQEDRFLLEEIKTSF